MPRAEDRLSTFLMTVSDGFVALDKDLVIQLANPAMQDNAAASEPIVGRVLLDVLLDARTLEPVLRHPPGERVLGLRGRSYRMRAMRDVSGGVWLFLAREGPEDGKGQEAK
jgi:hypothetical protein